MSPLTKVLDCRPYLVRSESLGVDPNFYLSLPYLTFFNAVCRTDGDWIWVEDDGACLFPPLPVGDRASARLPVTKVWSDFANHRPYSRECHFLDWEYLYDPRRFNDMSGGQWITFRKNSRKWPRAHTGWTYRTLPSPTYTLDIEKLVIGWLTEHESNAQDPDLLAQWALSPLEGVFRKILYDENDRPVAINAWDENHRYINFRVCLCNDDPFLSEFARLLFYTDPEVQARGKLVNDGGTLGNTGLEVFKDKLLPVRKRKVYSWS